MLQQEFDNNLYKLTQGVIAGKVFLLAVSGGRDSMTMANLFLKSSHKPKFVIAHVNFSLRGDESNSDECLVKEWAENKGIVFHSKTFDTHMYAKDYSLSTQMAARELRYEWFYELIEEYSYDYLSIAHNQDDTVETLFINLLRGTGVRGLTGIKSVNGKIIRPLISISRQRITEYASEREVVYRDDASNFESHYVRNKIRNIVFEEFRKINPSFLDTIYRSISYFSEAAELLSDQIEVKRKEIFFEKDGVGVLDVSKLKVEKFPAFWLDGILREYGFNSSQLEQIESAMDKQSGKKFASSEYELITYGDKIKIYPIFSEQPSPFEIDKPGVYSFGNHTFKVDMYLKPKDFEPQVQEGQLFMDAKFINFPICCRGWQAADKFRPFGMKQGNKKLSDFFIDIKMDRRSKDMQPVITHKNVNNGEEVEAIVCLPNLRIDDRYKILPMTKIILEITMQECYE